MVGAGRETFAQVAVGTHAQPGTIAHDNRQAVPGQPHHGGAQEVCEMGEGLAHPAHGQSLPRVAEERGSQRAEPGGKFFVRGAQGIGPAGAGVADHGRQRGVRLEALPDDVPKRQARAPQAGVKTPPTPPRTHGHGCPSGWASSCVNSANNSGSETLARSGSGEELKFIPYPAKHFPRGYDI